MSLDNTDPLAAYPAERDDSSSDDDIVPIARKKIGGRQPGATNYSAEEVQCLLDLIKRLKPSSAPQWESLSAEYNKLQAFSPRTGENLNKKFQSLLKKKKFSDSGEIPPEVQLARTIHLSMRTNTDFETPPDLEHVLRTSASPVTMHVNDSSNGVISAARKSTGLLPPSGITSSSSTTSTMAAAAAAAVNRPTVSVADVTAAMQQICDQTKAMTAQDNAEMLALLRTISADMKMVLSQLAQLNAVNDMAQREDKAAKQARLH